ncbi:hypothetical protein TKK_0005112 [Trichogramma kaykai]
MESSDLFNQAIRVKEEPGDVPISENDSEMSDEIPDLENFQLLPLPFQQENSAHTLRNIKLDIKLETMAAAAVPE